jgi:hypothetical protein
MTAPDQIVTNVKIILATQGPSIHDSGKFRRGAPLYTGDRGTLPLSPHSHPSAPRPRRVIIVFLCCVAMSLNCCTKDPGKIPIGTDTFYYGNLDHGGKFGVNIGDSEPQFDGAIRTRGFTYEGVFGCTYTINVALGCQPRDTYAIYIASQWYKHGGLYIRIHHNKVAQIAWEFYLFPYIDF